MEQKIDYHIHTWFSDGVASPSSIVEKAAELGYDEIAITDHDGINGIQEALEAGRRAGISVIPGIELATETDEKTGLHILGYYIDPSNQHLCKVMEHLRIKRTERNEKLLALLSDMGYPLSIEDLTLREGQDYIGKPVIGRAMVKKGYIKHHKEVFEEGKFLESPEAKKIKKEKLNVKDAIALIKEAGGRAVLAHPIQIKGFGEKGSEEFYSNVEKLLVELKEMGLEGMECYHKDHDSKQAARFVEMAEKLGLWITKGSDFHGSEYQ